MNSPRSPWRGRGGGKRGGGEEGGRGRGGKRGGGERGGGKEGRGGGRGGRGRGGEEGGGGEELSYLVRHFSQHTVVSTHVLQSHTAVCFINSHSKFIPNSLDLRW